MANVTEEVAMRRLLLAALFATAPLALAAPSVGADEILEAHHTLESYQALPEAERSAYVAGLSDALNAAAASTGNRRLTLIAGCTQGFAPDELRRAAEEHVDIQMRWSASAPASAWFIQTMILVCQLQLPPE
jgi:hypothetical protein